MALAGSWSVVGGAHIQAFTLKLPQDHGRLSGVWCGVCGACGVLCCVWWCVCVCVCCGGACVWCVVKLGRRSLSLAPSLFPALTPSLLSIFPSPSLSLSFSLQSFFFSLLFLFLCSCSFSCSCSCSFSCSCSKLSTPFALFWVISVALLSAADGESPLAAALNSQHHPRCF